MSSLKTFRPLALAIALALSFNMQADADAPKSVSVKAGNLADALESLAKQYGVDVIYPSSELKGLKTSGVNGTLDVREAFRKVLEGTPLVMREQGGSVLVSMPGKTSDAAQSTDMRTFRGSANMQRIEVAQATGATAAATPQPPADETAGVSESGEITVTGTRIRTLNGEVTPFPVYAITSKELERRGVTRIADLRMAIPQLAPAIGYNDNMMNGGPSRAQMTSTSFDLRGLGGNSTLVLVNGRRVPHTGQGAPGGAGGREDFNIDGIPVSAIERIEILPQGAGAVYGSEAMAGVVNIILKKSYSGLEASLTHEGTMKGGADKNSVSVTTGFARGRFSSFVTASWDKQSPLRSTDRWWTSTDDLSQFGPMDFNTFVYNSVSRRGALASVAYPRDPFPGDPTLPGLTDYAVAIPSGSTGQNQTVGNYVAAGPIDDPFDSAPYTNQIDRQSNRSMVVNASFELAPQLELFAEGRWSRFENDTKRAPISTSWDLMLPEGYVGNPFAGDVYLNKVFYDLPSPVVESTHTNPGATLGARGSFGNNWRYDVSAAWSRNVVRDVGRNEGFSDALFDLMFDGNPANDPILAYDSSVPGANPNPAGLLESLLHSYDRKNVSDSYQYSASVDGPVWTGWAGDVKAAFGAERLREDVEFAAFDPDMSYLLTEPFSRTVNAAFGELSIPLVAERQNIPLVHAVTLSTAARYVDFSDIGNDVTTSLSGLYQPFSWLTLRASRTEGFKAPTLYDLKGPAFDYTQTLDADDRVFDTQRGGAAVEGTFDITSGGQENLNPERSVNLSYGIVFDVPFIQGLSFSINRWELDFEDQVGSAGFQTLIDFFPERVIRNGAGVITGFDTSALNLSKVESKGMDYQVSYRARLALGDITLSGAMSRNDGQVNQATPSSLPRQSTNPPSRSSASLYWSRGAWGAGAAVNYQGGFAPFFTSDQSQFYRPYTEVNPQVSWDGRGWTGNGALSRLLENTRLSLTVFNALNETPEVADVLNGRVIMDPRLRRYSLSVSHSF